MAHPDSPPPPSGSIEGARRAGGAGPFGPDGWRPRRPTRPDAPRARRRRGPTRVARAAPPGSRRPTRATERGQSQGAGARGRSGRLGRRRPPPRRARRSARALPVMVEPGAVLVAHQGDPHRFAFGSDGGHQRASEDDVVVAPLPGTLVDVSVIPGDSVRPGTCSGCSSR